MKQFIVSSASFKCPLYISPFFISTVTACPSPSCNSLIGTLTLAVATPDMRKENGGEQSVYFSIAQKQTKFLSEATVQSQGGHHHGKLNGDVDNS